MIMPSAMRSQHAPLDGNDRRGAGIVVVSALTSDNVCNENFQELEAADGRKVGALPSSAGQGFNVEII